MFNFSPRIVTNGLVLYLDAANTRSYPTTGTTWNDLTLNGNNGTLTNGPTFSSANLGSIVFDGVNDYVQCGNTPILTGLINITICCWVYPTQNKLLLFVNRYADLTFNQGWYLGFDNTTGKFEFDGRESVSAFLSVSTINSYNLNNWYYVVGAKSNNLWSIYINGFLQNSATIGVGTTPFSTNRLTIGGMVSAQAGSYFSANNISSVKIYNRALTASEILQNFNATKGRYGLL